MGCFSARLNVPMNPETSPTPALLNPLTFEEARVLGCLIEKENTTPEYYPLTLNQLVAACNQSSNRDPVVGFDDGTVQRALEGLKSRQLAFQLTIAGARVQKFKHNFIGKFARIEKPTLALMAVLLLRGQQTAGELRQRTERLYAFPDLASVEAALKELMEYPEAALVVQFPPGGGRKASSYAHLLSGPVDSQASPLVFVAPAVESAPLDADWKLKIEQELAELRAEVTRLRGLVESVSPDAEPADPTSGYVP